MKIVLDARFWRRETGGIGRYSRELLHGLLALKTDDQFDVILTPKDAEEFAVRDKRVTPHVVEVGHYSVAEQTKLPGILAALSPDLTHFLNFNQPLWYAGKRVTTIHDLTVKYFPVGRSQRDPIRRFAFNQIMARAAHSDGVIAISRSTKSDIIRDLKVEPTTIRVIGEAAGQEFAPLTPAEASSFRKRATSGRPYILFVNQWRPHKGLPELVRAFEQLKQHHKLPHQLVITGRASPHFPELAQAIEHSPVRADILTPGFVSDEDLPSYYAAADVLAFPSYYEGFGLGVLEAMQSGTPVVCSEVSSLPEVAGGAALFVEPGNVAGLTSALYRVLSDDKLSRQLRQLGIEQAAHFSWTKTAEQTYALYRTLAA
ncbi:MAG: glycosyltransferase family 1 protein [Patescibacteria group bacterium]